MAQRLSGAAVQLGVKSEEEVTMQKNFKQSQIIQNQMKADYENSPKFILYFSLRFLGGKRSGLS